MASQSPLVLALDVSNTHTHGGLVTPDGKVARVGHFPSRWWAEPEAAGEALGSWTEADVGGVAWSTVIPAHAEAIGRLLGEVFPAARLWRLTHETVPGLPLAYPRPAEIGHDRLANALGLQTRGAVPGIAIDLGTAISLDVVTSAGFAGGVIAPGLSLMVDYLHERTAQLPRLDPALLAPAEPGDPAIGQSTEEAMRIGTVVGFSGLAGALLDAARAQLVANGEGTPTVIATGGSARWLPARWRAEAVQAPHLTLEGLAAGWRRLQARA